jgi:hypothetical protein
MWTFVAEILISDECLFLRSKLRFWKSENYQFSKSASLGLPSCFERFIEIPKKNVL